MKFVRYTCDHCGEPAGKGGLGRQRVNCIMYTAGYGMMDGEHSTKGHICSVECGLAMVEEWLRGIKDPDYDPEAAQHKGDGHGQ